MFPVPSYASSAYHAEVGRWYDAVGEILAPRIWPDGPIVMVQVENEAAFYFRNGRTVRTTTPTRSLLAKVAQQLRRSRRRRRARMRYGAGRRRRRSRSREPGRRLVVHCDWAHFERL
jgi:hypothetical protein